MHDLLEGKLCSPMFSEKHLVQGRPGSEIVLHLILSVNSMVKFGLQLLLLKPA